MMQATKLPTPDPIELELPADAASIARARNTAGEFARRAGGPRDDVELAVSEAVTNCIVHAFPGGAKGTIRLSAEVRGARMAVTVSDNGTGMRPNLSSRGLGIGIPLIGRVSDEYRFEDDPGGGAVVTMLFVRAEDDES